MDKKFFRHLSKLIRPISPWAFLVVAVVSGLVCMFSLRNNNLTALKLRDKVNAADQANGDVEGALRELREYVYSHMNTDLSSGPNAIKPPIQLKYTYERLVAAQLAKSGNNTDIYNEAQKECEKQYPKGYFGAGRIPCVTNYINSRTSGSPVNTDIPDSLYKFDFVPPLWPPDLAGWSLIVASVSTALFVIRFGMDRWIKAELRDL